jgi:hypothetical protein
MSRTAAVTLLVALPFVLGADDPPPGTKPAQKSLPPLIERQRQLVRTLSAPVVLERAFDGVPLQDFLEFLADRHDMTIVINDTAFKETLGDARAGELAVRVPRMRSITFRSLLDHGLGYIGGVALVKGDRLEIVPKGWASREVFGSPVGDDAELHQRELSLVNVLPDRVPLEAVLTDIAEQADRNVVLDPRVDPNLRKAAVTVRLLNAPVDSAVQLVARTHDLVAVKMDNTYVVTTPDRMESFKPVTRTELLTAPAAAK